MFKVIAGIIIGLMLYPFFFEINVSEELLADLEEQVSELESCIYDYEEHSDRVHSLSEDVRSDMEDRYFEDMASNIYNLEELTSNDPCY